MAFPFFTIGHSTRPIGEFIDLLVASEVGLVVDVRTIPKSRHNPQFGEEELEAQFISLCWLEASDDLDVSLLCRAETYLLACNPFINKFGA